MRERPGSPSAHRLINPAELGPANGFTHAVVARGSRAIFLAGQAAQGPDGAIRGETIAEQFGVAIANLALALERAGAAPQDLVSIQIYTTDIAEYRAAEAEIGRRYRAQLGSHFPAMALVEVSRLYEPEAKVELVAIAVAPYEET